ncbi:glycoside hydrolase family 32 protein [Allofournierella sp.]|uniref:glycoside hydrolase family 32 protein n=1 Tax=Allofournierella sp. TaxID=1940256 RepID=UPI003AB38E83
MDPSPHTAHRRRLAHAHAARAKLEPLAAASPLRQRYHFMPPAGWANDPNGCVYYNGRHHLFYQHNPYAPHWGSMHWGHAVSPDLLHWQHLPLALAPSGALDDDPQGGCFSGCSVPLPGGMLGLVYTAVNAHARNPVTQCLALSRDGVHFDKPEHNPIVAGLPPNVPCDLRDPKVLRHGGFWYMVLGAALGGSARQGGDGGALLYRSADLLKWDYLGVFAQSQGRFGTMWECPDLFPLGNKWVLTFSPMFCGAKTAVYWVGEMDFETPRFTPQQDGVLDWGGEYYAAQSYGAPGGRRIAMAWQNGWDWMPGWKSFGPTAQQGWCGCMALPRQLQLDPAGRLTAAPVAELNGLRLAPVRVERRPIAADEVRLPCPSPDCCELELRLFLDGATARRILLDLRIAEGRYTRILLDLEAGELFLDRTHSDGGQCNGNRKAPLKVTGGELLLRIFCDTISVELFGERGCASMSSLIYPEKSLPYISLRTEQGQITASYTCWPLRPCV